MGGFVKGLALLGSTGSIGTQTLDIVRAFPGRFKVVGLAARRSFDLLSEQVQEFRPRLVSCDGNDIAPLRAFGCEEASLDEMVLDDEVDLVITATVGDVALGPTITALKAGKNVALANKESIVMAGEYLTRLAREHGANLLPLDSEPNAIWQCLRGEDRKIEKLIITASGGAMRHASKEELAQVTPERALKHPTWKMGPKITIDSATLMNKGFEVIESRWLFDVPWERIDVVIHPQSIIHSMVEFEDGSVKAQLSPPDMRLPIQYALFYPDRTKNGKLPRFDPVKTGALTFERMDPERYPCFELAMEYGRRGGTWPAALCGADEAAVEAFLGGKLRFLDIATTIERALESHKAIEDPTPEQSIKAANWAGSRVVSLVEKK
ncbi:MAG: 1-deoxy-D-xylulose-5-phosphate reductoisomerase [SAR202 cluster bacterium]|nr:1-deoxy-D-xylulose-5-phosphate reductoisomerase [SAR202 cluster bacterium]